MKRIPIQPYLLFNILLYLLIYLLFIFFLNCKINHSHLNNSYFYDKKIDELSLSSCINLIESTCNEDSYELLIAGPVYCYKEGFLDGRRVESYEALYRKNGFILNESTDN